MTACEPRAGGSEVPPDVGLVDEDASLASLAREASANRFGAFGEIGENPNAPMSELLG